MGSQVAVVGHSMTRPKRNTVKSPPLYTAAMHGQLRLGGRRHWVEGILMDAVAMIAAGTDSTAVDVWAR